MYMVSNPVVRTFLVWAAIVCHLGASGVLPHSQIRDVCYLVWAPQALYRNLCLSVWQCSTDWVLK